MVNLSRSVVMAIFMFQACVQDELKMDDPFLQVHFFPVGEGDATIIECDDQKGEVSITLVNAGSISSRKKEMAVEYYTFLETILSRPNYYLKNVIITNSNPRYYNFIEPLMAKEEANLKKVRFYVGGHKISYVILKETFKTSENVFEFTRRNEIHGNVSSCGHFGGDNETFYTCVKRDTRGPIENSSPIIPLCKAFQISVMAANYGLSRNNVAEQNETAAQRKCKNSLVLKVTPTGKSSPSILMGDFENDGEHRTMCDAYFYNYIKDAHDYYTSSEKFPLSLSNGLSSTVIKIPQNGASTDATIENNFYRDFVQPTYAIISSDISDSNGHPSCEVLEAVNNYLSMFSRNLKSYQCHPIKSTIPVDVKIATNGSDNLYQTSTIALNHFPRGKVQYNLITLIMTSREISKPTSKGMFQTTGYK